MTTKQAPDPQRAEEQEDGSFVWPADPDFVPSEIAEQDLEPVEDPTLTVDYAEPDPGTSEEDEEPPSKKAAAKEEE